MKLELYRKFTNALAVCVIASVAWIAYEVRVHHFTLSGAVLGLKFKYFINITLSNGLCINREQTYRYTGGTTTKEVMAGEVLNVEY